MSDDRTIENPGEMHYEEFPTTHRSEIVGKCLEYIEYEMRFRILELAGLTAPARTP